MFLIKKTISLFLMPLPFSLLLCAFGLYCLLFTKKQTLGKSATVLGVILISLSCYAPFANLLISPLENQYSSFDIQTHTVEYVAILGNGHASDPRMMENNQLSTASLSRLIEGIRIHNANPHSKIIVSGYGGLDPIANAVVVAKVAQQLGVSPENLIIQPSPRDTHSEAVLVSSIVKDSRCALVSSAAHFPRAMALFEHQGVQPIAAPANYLSKLRANEFSDNYRFSAQNLEKTESAVHEYLGMAWAKLKGQI
jgi:uncharacterized SAM-binding protein YcdF (DUF218 family)